MKRYIPDFITSMNIACGAVGVIFAFNGRIDLAFLFMLAAAVFDFFDGFAARALDAYSDLGKELDSLADDISFGVLPSVMLYTVCRNAFFAENWFCFVPLLIAVFSGIRLAKFNVDERQHSSFLGLPTPACAMICGSLAYFVAHCPTSAPALWFTSPVFIIALTIVLCALLVCELPMFSFKFSREDSKSLISKRIAFGACCLVCLAFAFIFSFNWSLVVLLSLTAYVLLNTVFAILKV